MIPLLMTVALAFQSASAIDCSKTVSRYQKMQCNNIQKLMVSKIDTSKIPAYQPPQFKAGSDQTLNDKSTTVAEETNQQYTPGKQYNHSSPSRYVPPTTTPSKPPKKTYFTPY